MYRLFDSTGEPLTESQPVSESFGEGEFNARVASLGEDGFVVVWRQSNATNDGQEIVGRLFNLDGTASTEPNQVISSSETTSNALPELVSLSDGGFIVLWHSVGADNHSLGVSGTRFDADFNRVTDEFIVNSAQYGRQDFPAATLLANNELVVTYTGSDGDNGGANFGTGVFVEHLSPGVQADEDTEIPLNLVFSNTDVDGSEFADDIQLSGLPAGTVVSDGITDVEITGFGQVVFVTRNGMQVENLTVTPPDDFYGDIRMAVTYVTRDSDGSETVEGNYRTFIALIRVNPVNDVASYDPIIPTVVSENGTAEIDVDSVLELANDPDSSGIFMSATPIAGYDLNAATPIVENGGVFEWNSTSGTAGPITFDAADVQFNVNPDSEYPGINAAFDLDGSGGGELSIENAKTLEVLFRPDETTAQQTLIEFGDADSGWGLYLFNGQIELHFRSPDAPANVTPQVLTGGQLSSSEFNQVIVAFSPIGYLEGNQASRTWLFMSTANELTC